jgi:hypothetical protein
MRYFRWVSIVGHPSFMSESSHSWSLAVHHIFQIAPEVARNLENSGMYNTLPLVLENIGGTR